MTRKGFSEEQIGSALRRAEASTAVPEICRPRKLAHQPTGQRA